jgi:UrcA family protein
MYSKLFVLVLATGSALGLVDTGTASSAEPPQIAVSYQDLDLSRPTDARVLYGRLQRAASEVCQPVPHRELARYRAWQQCYDAALEGAVNQLNAPQVLALHKAGAGNPARG